MHARSFRLLETPGHKIMRSPGVNYIFDKNGQHGELGQNAGGGFCLFSRGALPGRCGSDHPLLRHAWPWAVFLILLPDKFRQGAWKYMLNGVISGSFQSQEAAKLSAFDAVLKASASNSTL